MKTSKFLLALMLAVVATTVQAQTDSIAPNRVITRSRMIGVGWTEILDTYLSPEKYQGTELRYLNHTLRERPSSPWSRLIVHQGRLAYADNRAGEGGEMAGMYNFRYGLLRSWTLLGDKLRIQAGGVGDLNLGFVYNTRNGNNPAQARLSANIGPIVVADWHFTLGSKPFALRYEATAPLVGVMFSPNYGQSYYEIFSRGNYDHNVVPTTPVCAPTLHQMLTLDFRLLRTTWRIGYACDIEQAHVNNLKQHTYSHALVLGVVKRFTLLHQRP